MTNTETEKLTPTRAYPAESMAKTPGVEVSVVESDSGFAALEGEWDELYRECPAATPFQSWAWLYSWWESYGEDYELRLVCVREEGEGSLVGVLPLMLERGDLRRLLFVGTGLTDYNDALVRAGWEGKVSEVGMRAIKRMASWRLVDLQQLRPEAAAWKVFGEWSGFKARVWQENCPVLDVKPWKELLAPLSRNRRSTASRTVRRAEKDQVRRKLAVGEEVGLAARRLVALHREEWQGRNIDPRNLTERFEAHTVAAARRMTNSRLAVICECWQNGEVIASQFFVYGRDFVGYWLSGSSQEASKRYQISSLIIHNGADIASDRKSARLDLLRGQESYKLTWKPSIVANYRLMLGRNPLSWGPYVAYHVLRSKAKSYVYSEQGPQWVANALRYLKKLSLRRSLKSNIG